MQSIKIAKIKKSFGIYGFVSADLFIKEIFDFLKIPDFINSCLVGKQKDAELIPLTKIKRNGKSLLLKIKTVNNRTQADKYTGFFLFSDYKFPASFYLLELVGFCLYNLDKNLGRITQVYKSKAHGILVLKDKEHPFVDKFIKQIDWKNKKVTMDFPFEL